MQRQPMAVEDHPLYPKWHAALERVIAAKAARDVCREGTPAWTVAESELQKAYIGYDLVAREV
jgi:hypothetical protein